MNEHPMSEDEAPSPAARRVRRISGLEVAGLALLGIAVLQNQFRRRTATLAMRAYKVRREATMSISPPGATTALIAAALLEQARRNQQRAARPPRQ
jgi:hypothetical protein